MITVEFCQMMARYNAWQNKSMMSCLQSIDDKELRKDRKAFFGSIFGTANHLLWGDKLWMSRFDDGPLPDCAPKDSPMLHRDFQSYLEDRKATDKHILRWTQEIDRAELVGELNWYSGASERDMTQPRAVCVTHFFNHQTHHRGQIHAMLTAAGAKPDDTDLVFLPEQE